MIASVGNLPEMLAGLEPMIASDLYMAGYLLNYLLTGGNLLRPYREVDCKEERTEFGD